MNLLDFFYFFLRQVPVAVKILQYAPLEVFVVQLFPARRATAVELILQQAALVVSAPRPLHQVVLSNAR